MDGDWDLDARRPAPALRPYVAYYSGYRQTGGTPGVHRGLPSPYLTMIVAFGDPLTMVSHPDPATPGGDYWTLVGGLHTRPAFIGHPGRQSGIQIAVRPLGVRALFGLPAGELSHVDLTGGALLGPLAAELSERVQAAPTWAARFAALDDGLTRALRPATDVRAEVVWAWRSIVASAGAVRVADLAAEIGISARYLDATLLRETGLTPKAAAKVVRFDRAKRLLATGPPTIAEVAAACGYFDQAHLARDFRDLAGCSPSAWMAEEFRFFQAVPGDDDAE